MQQKKENDNIMNYDTVRLDDENNAIIIIDQTKLPGSIELIALKTAEEIWDAIYLLRVRGAPAIGVAAAFGIYLLAKRVFRFCKTDGGQFKLGTEPYAGCFRGTCR